MKHFIVKGNQASWGDRQFTVTLGRNGFKPEADKREGDGCTPTGAFTLEKVYYRKDRVGDITSELPTEVITETSGWCDDPKSKDYNRFVTLPRSDSHEKLWLERHIYDIVIVTSHNTDPTVAGLGSAVFIHLPSENFGPTDGCIGVPIQDLRAIVAEAVVGSKISLAAS